MSVTRRRREKHNHNKSKHMRGGRCSFTSNSLLSHTLFGGRRHTPRKQHGGADDSSQNTSLQNTPSYMSTVATQAQQQLSQGASAVYGRVKVVTDKATQAITDQGVKIMDELQSQATEIIDEVKDQVSVIINAALADLKIQAKAAAKQAVADALVAAKSQIKMG